MGNIADSYIYQPPSEATLRNYKNVKLDRVKYEDISYVIHSFPVTVLDFTKEEQPNNNNATDNATITAIKKPKLVTIFHLHGANEDTVTTSSSIKTILEGIAEYIPRNGNWIIKCFSVDYPGYGISNKKYDLYGSDELHRQIYELYHFIIPKDSEYKIILSNSIGCHYACRLITQLHTDMINLYLAQCPFYNLCRCNGAGWLDVAFYPLVKQTGMDILKSKVPLYDRNKIKILAVMGEKDGTIYFDKNYEDINKICDQVCRVPYSHDWFDWLECAHNTGAFIGINLEIYFCQKTPPNELETIDLD